MIFTKTINVTITSTTKTIIKIIYRCSVGLTVYQRQNIEKSENGENVITILYNIIIRLSIDDH